MSTPAQPAPLEVSDHALVRFAERILGYDTEAVRLFLAIELTAQVAVLGDGKFPFTYGEIRGTAIIRGGRIITILINENDPS